MKRLFLGTLLLISMLFSGCATTGDLERLELKHYKLRDLVKSLREEQIVLKARIARLQAQLRKLNDVFSQFKKKGQYNFANIGVKLDELRTHHQELLGKFQVLKLSFDKLQEQHQKLFQAYSERFGDPTKTDDSNQKVTIQIVDAAALYNSSKELYKSEKYREAREQLKMMIQRFPDHDLTDDAYVLIGMCYEKEKEYSKAIEWYSKYLSKYPKGDRLDFVLLRLGAAHYRIKACVEGRQYFRHLIRKFPTSQHAKLARKLLRNSRYYCR